MTPLLGITTQVIRKSKWYKDVHNLGFDAVEINRRNSKLHFNLYFLEKVKRYIEDVDVSVHSGTAGMFQSHASFTEANLSVLNAEIDLCRVLGASQLVFHLDDGILSVENRRRLGEVLARAADLGVDMLYESNSALVAEDAFDLLESFPGIGYVLDLGHLNNGHGKGVLGCEIDDFLRQVRHRVVYVHASNNSGKRDEHIGLDDGTLDWRHVLDSLDLEGVHKIIIEVRAMEMVEASRQALHQYLEEGFAAQERLAVGAGG